MPQIFAPELPPLNRTEVFIAEAQLEHGRRCELADLTTERLLTVCLLFDPSPTIRRAARSLAATFVTATCAFEQPNNFVNGPGAVHLLQARLPATVNLVVGLPDEYDSAAEREVNAILGYLRVNGRHNLQLSVAVAEAPASWAACAFEGSVVSRSAQNGGDALRMFNMLAALMSPDYLCPFDACDIASCIGSASQPSLLVSATFFRDSGEVIPDSTDADKKLRTCAAIAFAPATHSIRLAELHRLFNALRSIVRSDCHLIQMAGAGLAVETLTNTGSIPVQLLTRPTLS